MKRVACYVRVSTEEQRDRGISVDSQIDALEEYCKDNGYKVVGVYNDAGISARKSYKKRPALLRLIDDCKAGKIDLIIFTKLDRWFRSVADYYDVQRVLDEYGVKWRCIWEDYEIETSTGVFKVNIMLSVAQSEADRTSERINKVFEYKRAKGEVCTGGVALGYKIENKRWVRDEKTAPFIEAIFDKYLSTFSVVECQNACIDLGRNIARNTVSKILSAPAYYGGLNYVDYTYITKEQHEIIENSRRKYVRHYRRDYIFTGLCYCGLCGRKMTAEQTIRYNKNGTRKTYQRYMCANHKQSIRYCNGASCSESFLEEYLLSNIESEMDKYNMDIMSSDTNDINKKLARAKGKLNRIKDLYELGDIELDEYKEKRNKLLEEINSLEAMPTKKSKELPSNWKEVYLSLDNKHKNAFWLGIISRIETSERMATQFKIYF